MAKKAHLPLDPQQVLWAELWQQRHDGIEDVVGGGLRRRRQRRRLLLRLRLWRCCTGPPAQPEVMYCGTPWKCGMPAAAQPQL